MNNIQYLIAKCITEYVYINEIVVIMNNNDNNDKMIKNNVVSGGRPDCKIV